MGFFFLFGVLSGGCSTVLIPARVLQTLQQHFNNVGAVSQSKGGDVCPNSQWQNGEYLFLVLNEAFKPRHDLFLHMLLSSSPTF